MITLPKKDGQPTNVTFRGGDARRPSRCAAASSIVEGRMFTPGLDEVIVGDKICRPHPGPRPRRRRSSTSRSSSKIVGVFTSQGGAFESEIWGDFDVIGADFQRGTGGSNSLVVRMKDGADIPALDRWIRAQPQMQLQALSERKYYEDQAGPLATILRVPGQLASPSSWASAPSSGP